MWLSEVICLKEDLWCGCEGGTKNPGQCSRHTPFPTKRAAQSWGMDSFHSSALLRPSLFGLLEALALKGTCTVNAMLLNAISLGCYSMSDLHPILLQDVDGSIAGRSSPHEHPGFLQCSATLCQPRHWHHNSYIPPSPSLRHVCISTRYITSFAHNNLLHGSMVQPFEY